MHARLGLAVEVGKDLLQVLLAIVALPSEQVLETGLTLFCEFLGALSRRPLLNLVSAIFRLDLAFNEVAFLLTQLVRALAAQQVVELARIVFLSLAVVLVLVETEGAHLHGGQRSPVHRRSRLECQSLLSVSRDGAYLEFAKHVNF